MILSVCVFMCVSSHLFWPATQEEGHTVFLHLPSAVLALVFFARKIQPFLSLDDREVEFCGVIFYFVCLRKTPSSCDCTEIRTHVPTSEGFEIINHHQGDRLHFFSHNNQLLSYLKEKSERI